MFGNWQVLWAVALLSVVIVSLVFSRSEVTTYSGTKRAISKDKCITRHGGIEIDYVSGSSSSYTFDLCSVINCRGNNHSWRGYDLYLCDADLDPRSWCSTWAKVVKYTGPPWSGHYQEATLALQRDWSTSSNPVTMSIINQVNFPPGGRGPCDSNHKQRYLVLGVDITGKDPMGVIKVNVVPPPTNDPATPSSPTPSPPHQQSIYSVVDYTQIKPQDVIAKATGYGDENLWLSWVAQTVKEQSAGDCVACAAGRPALVTAPAPLITSDVIGFRCMLNLTAGRDRGCESLGSIFPPINNKTLTGPFTPDGANGTYVCFNVTTDRCLRNHKKNSTILSLGQIDSTWCREVRAGTELGTWARAGLYYYCGGHKLHIRIPPHTRGVCAMVRLRTPLILLGDRRTHAPANNSQSSRSRRDADMFDLSLDNPTYIDAIGVPRGVPNHFKLADQIAAGFENLPLIAGLIPVTPNKNVDRINYVHYNVLRLTNLTRDAVAGLSEQVAPTSLMAVQNRMALDMLLAERGGVCAMFGDMCCTFIPNNTAPDGSVSRALEGLRTLSETMHDHSGIDNPLEGWFNDVFGKWKNLVLSLLVSLAVFTAILVTCGCCCVPCVRSLVVRLITTTIEGKPPPLYQMTLLSEDRNGAAEGDSRIYEL